MTTEEINTIVHEYTVSHGAIPAPLNFCGFLKVSVPRSTIRFATEYRRHRTF